MDAKIHAEGSVATTRKALAGQFGGLSRFRIALEVGTHSPWLSRLLSSLGREGASHGSKTLAAQYCSQLTIPCCRV